MTSEQQPTDNRDEMLQSIALGGGAQFWAYVSPQNETASRVPTWEVTLEQQDGDWTGTITSANPQQVLQTPGLSGTFSVKVVASGPEFGPSELSPQPGTQPEVGCNANCAAMIGIVANPTDIGARYWTVWDAMCSRDD